MAQFNPLFSGILFFRRIGLAIGAYLLASGATYAIANIFNAATAERVSSGAAGIAWGAALLAFFLPRVNQGQMPVRMDTDRD